MAVTLSEAAANQVKELKQTQKLPDNVFLRMGVKGGGCSGLSYTFAWEKQARPGDEVFETSDGTKIFVDKKSHQYLNGTVLDCDTNMLGQSLVFRNPNAKSTCGCGVSFGV